MRATFYQVLGVPPNAKMRQIRAAIRSMLIIATLLPFLKKDKVLSEAFASPDLSSDLLCLAHHASIVLLDPRSRSQYDQCLAKNLHRQNINQNRYRMLLQYTGGATRRAGTPSTSGTHVQGTFDHLGLLPVGFQLACEEYWAYVKSIRLWLLALIVLGIQLGWIWSELLHPHLASDAVWWLDVTAKAAKTGFFIAVLTGGIFALHWFILRRISIAESGSLEEVSPLSNAEWTMLELSESWRRSDRVFLGDESTHEDAAWVFRVKMSQLARSDIGMAAKISPGRRIWARSIDIACWSSICLAVLGLNIEGSLDWVRMNPLLGTGAVLWAITLTWMIMEALLLSMLNTTLGGCLAGVTVHFRTTTFYPAKLGKIAWYANFPAALKRSWALWWYGLGAGIAPVGGWFAARFAWMNRNKKESPWDAHADSIVMIHPIMIGHTLIGVALLVGVIIMWALTIFV